MYRLETKELQRMVEMAKQYGCGEEECAEYLGSVGWEEWMNEFTEVPEGEPITEEESHEIDEVLREIFWYVHGRTYNKRSYWHYQF